MQQFPKKKRRKLILPKFIIKNAFVAGILHPIRVFQYFQQQELLSK